MYKAHHDEYMKDMDRKWKEGAAERNKSYEELEKKKSKIVIPQVHYTAEDENWDDCDYANNVFENK
jgi:esterase/lipase